MTIIADGVPSISSFLGSWKKKKKKKEMLAIPKIDIAVPIYCVIHMN